ncbi:DUF2200 family protein [Arenibacter aquaticus]|uniref:DUF2200 family protein n=1 Tax=Arenibacter aquaticus TaxID=2489054 RepID=A0A430K1N3_9FLAO|nr:DUF2200 family protein [Arenibacter aquaticus]
MEEIINPIRKQVKCLDKMVIELAKDRKME